MQCLSVENANNNFHYFVYANITSMDIERSFLKYSAILTSKRTGLKESHIEGILMMDSFARTHQMFAPTQSALWRK